MLETIKLWPYVTYDLLHQGDVSALMTLGAFYSRGTGVEKNLEKSFNCYKEAADQGMQYWLPILPTIKLWHCLIYPRQTDTQIQPLLGYIKHCHRLIVSKNCNQAETFFDIYTSKSSVCLPACLSVCLPVCLSVCLSVSLSACLLVSLLVTQKVRQSVSPTVSHSVCSINQWLCWFYVGGASFYLGSITSRCFRK